MHSLALVVLVFGASLVAGTPQYDPNHGAHNYIGRHGSTTASSPAPAVPSSPAATATATTTTTATASGAAKPTDAAGSNKNATTPVTAAGSGSAAPAQATAKPQDNSAGMRGIQVGSTFALLAVSGALVVGL